MFRNRKIDGWRDVLLLCLLLVAVQQLAGAGMIKAKAWLAPFLIERAWAQTLQTGRVGDKPWPWADTWPVARLRAPSQGVDLLVLAGDSGNALAFGPGHAEASAAPGSAGQSVIGGHRDTHFAFLRNMQPRDSLLLQLPSGAERHYEVKTLRVVNAERETLSMRSDGESLLLVTCYPFGSLLPGGPLRYVVSAAPRSPGQDTLAPAGAPARRYHL